MSHSDSAALAVAGPRRVPAGYVSWKAWLAPVVGAMAYPLLLKVLFVAAGWASTRAGVAGFAATLCAVVAAALALAMPAIALRGLLVLRKSTDRQAPRMRMILHFAFAGPPLYLLTAIPAAILAITIVGTGDLASKAALAQLLWFRDLLWWSIWLAVMAVLVLRSQSSGMVTAGDAAPSRPRGWLNARTAGLRSIHRYIALAVVLAFVALHLGNHLVALWSIEAQDAVMRVLRLWYRAPGVEAVLLMMFAVGVVAGLLLVVRWTRMPGDTYRVLQTSSGFYLALFLINHAMAVFRERGRGGDTDWAFATGGDPGILGSEIYTAVFLYYVAAVLLVCVHLGAGLRMVCLRRGLAHDRANRVFLWSTAFGGGLAALTAAALLGVRLGEGLGGPLP